MKLRPLLLVLILLIGLLSGCAMGEESTQIAATTLPVYQFTTLLCEGTNLKVERLITENVSCLHDYTLQVNQMRIIESSDLVVLSGAGLEDFMDDALLSVNNTIDASDGIDLLSCNHGHVSKHQHESDPHIWLSPENAKVMASNICEGLVLQYPDYEETFRENLASLTARLDELQTYGDEALSQLSCRELITFHDGFAYLAKAFDLTILKAIEEESGSEASANELTDLIALVKEHQLPAIFTEVQGSTSAAGVIAAETGAEVYSLDMAMAGEDYFEAMYHNIDTIKEALG